MEDPVPEGKKTPQVTLCSGAGGFELSDPFFGGWLALDVFTKSVELFSARELQWLTCLHRRDGGSTRNLRLPAIIEVDAEDLGRSTPSSCHIGGCALFVDRWLVTRGSRMVGQVDKMPMCLCDKRKGQDQQVRGEEILDDIPSTWAGTRACATLYHIRR